MKKYSPEYWLAHCEYAMGHKPKIDIDTSNSIWTKNNLNKILNNKHPHGMTGTNMAKGLMKYIKIYHPERFQDIAKLMLRYIEETRTNTNPPNMVGNFYESIIE